MDTQIKEILEDAGWYPGRCIDTADMIAHITKLGYGVPSMNVLHLFEAYWNIELNFVAPNGEFGSVRLNVEEANAYSEFVLNKIIAITQEEQVFPVGSINDYVADILVAESGKFYMAHESGLFLIGEDLMSALESIVYQKDILRIS